MPVGQIVPAGQALPDSHYQAVAEVYLEADEAKEGVGQAVAATWNVPRGTAHRWIREARMKGLLPSVHAGCTPRQGLVLQRIADDLGVDVEALIAAIKRHGNKADRLGGVAGEAP